MATVMLKTVTLKGEEVSISGELPQVGMTAPDFKLVNSDLQECSLSDFSGKSLVLNIFPSIDTPVCQKAVSEFNRRIGANDTAVVLCISKDLPFAHKRFCGAEGVDNVVALSSFRGDSFGTDYGIQITSGALAGLFARAVVVIDQDGKVVHAELAPEIANEPDYGTVEEVVG